MQISYHKQIKTPKYSDDQTDCQKIESKVVKPSLWKKEDKGSATKNISYLMVWKCPETLDFTPIT